MGRVVKDSLKRVNRERGTEEKSEWQEGGGGSVAEAVEISVYQAY